MLVPSMTLQEIKQALVTDYSRELKFKLKGLLVCCQGKWARGGQKDYTETISHISKSKNHWRITVQVRQHTVAMTPYMVAYNNVGITASHIKEADGVTELRHFNTHFFKRYRERLNLNIEKPEEVVKHFFRKNTHIITGYYPMPDGTHQLFCPIDGGLGLGKYHEESGIIEFKTFVDDSLLHENQKRDLATIWRNNLNNMDQTMLAHTIAMYNNTWWSDYAA